MLILCRHKSSASLQPPPEKVLQQYLEEQLIALLIKGPVAKRLAVGDPDAEESGRWEGLGTGCAAPDAYTVHGLRCYGHGGSGTSFRRSDLRLLGVMGRSRPSHPSRPNCCLSSPARVPPLTRRPRGTSCTSTRRRRPATSCCCRCRMGKVRMVASEFETGTPVIKNRGPTSRAAAAAAVEQDSFVLLQMAPDMWYLELSNISNS